MDIQTNETESKVVSRNPLDEFNAPKGFEPINDRLIKFNLGNTFVVQDATSKAVRETSPMLESDRKIVREAKFS